MTTAAALCLTAAVRSQLNSAELAKVVGLGKILPHRQTSWETSAASNKSAMPSNLSRVAKPLPPRRRTCGPSVAGPSWLRLPLGAQGFPPALSPLSSAPEGGRSGRRARRADRRWIPRHRLETRKAPAMSALRRLRVDRRCGGQSAGAE